MLNPKFSAKPAAGTKSLGIRELSELCAERAKVVGIENVYDFTLGNPSTPPPQAVLDCIKELAEAEDQVAIHGYSSNQGFDETREAIAKSYNRRFGCNMTKDNFIMVSGATTALHTISIILNIDENSEIIAIAPFFPAYHTVAAVGGNKLVIVPPDTENFQINMEALEAAINPNTQGVIINSPNNPSGTIYSPETIQKIADLLTKKSEEYGHAIYIIADEPYRELVYTDEIVPYIPDYYPNTIIAYSYSKSLSFAGDRIGYVCTDNNIEDFDGVWRALKKAALTAGNVCAPSFFQRVIEKCVDVEPNMDDYIYNRNLLMNGLQEIGIHTANPSGAFYLFVQAPFGMSAPEFAELCVKHDIYIVPADSFGCPGWLRLSYCVSRATCEGSLPGFAAAYKEAEAMAAAK